MNRRRMGSANRLAALGRPSIASLADLGWFIEVAGEEGRKVDARPACGRLFP
jgi:hypothetical protein